MQRGCIVLAEAPAALVEICGISVLERLLRTLQRCGVRDVTIVSRTLTAVQPSPARRDLRVVLTTDANRIVDVVGSGDLFLIVRGDTVYDPRLLTLLLGQEHARALSNGAAAVAASIDFSGLDRIDIATLPQYSPELRRNLSPYCLSIAAAPAGQIVRALIDATQKGAQDFPALLHAPIEKFFVARLCRTRITPHQLTITWIVLAFIAAALFAAGHIGWGIALALIIGILDGLDGKLARLRVETSHMGKLEHRFDSFFEVAWPSVLALHFFRAGELPNAFPWLGLLIVGLIIDGLAKAWIYDAFAQMMRPPNLLDRLVRLVGVRRNVFIWILLIATVAGAPAQGFVFAACWQLLIAIVDLAHAWRLQVTARRWHADTFDTSYNASRPSLR